MSISALAKSILVFLLAGVIAACQLVTSSDSEVNINSVKAVVENDETILVDRVSYTQQDIAIEANILPVQKAILASSEQNKNVRYNRKSKDKKITEVVLTLVAEVDAPVYDGETLQATDVRVDGNKAYVVYNTAGERFLGAVEVFDIKKSDEPVLISSAFFPNTDINGIAEDGGEIYLAGATDLAGFSTPAVLIRIKLAGGKLTNDVTTIDMPSFAATDVETAKNYVYVTTGADEGQIIVLKQKDFTEVNRYAMDDVRGIDADKSDIAVISGTNGVSGASAKLITFEKNLGTLELEHDLSGATIKYSKATIEIKKEKAILAMGDGGTQVVCLDDGEVLKQIDIPVVDGLDPALAVTNSATAYKRSLFMGNGEAGVYVAIADENLDSKDCDVDTLEVVGRLKLDSILVDGNEVAQSVNHILYRKDTLFIAAGLGGLKVIEVDDSEASEDDDDAEDEDDDGEDKDDD